MHLLLCCLTPVKAVARCLSPSHKLTWVQIRLFSHTSTLERDKWPFHNRTSYQPLTWLHITVCGLECSSARMLRWLIRKNRSRLWIILKALLKRSSTKTRPINTSTWQFHTSTVNGYGSSCLSISLQICVSWRYWWSLDESISIFAFNHDVVLFSNICNKNVLKLCRCSNGCCIRGIKQIFGLDHLFQGIWNITQYMTIEKK